MAEPAAVGGTPSSIERYLVHLEKHRHLASHTLTSYGRDLATLVAMVASEAVATPLEAVGDAHIRRYAAKLHARGLAPRSIARTLSAWRGYFDWRVRYEDASGNPVIDVHPPKLNKRLPKALSESLTMQLLDGASKVDTDDVADPGLAIRDAAIYELLYSSGLRLAELVGLDVAHVKDGRYASSGYLDLAEAQVTVTGKGNKERTVPVGAKARETLAQWLAVRAAWIKADPHPLFLSTRGERLSGRSIQTRLKTHARRADVPANVHPHVLRHSFASHLLQASGDLRAVQELLGHASIAATQVYTSLDFKRLSEVYDAAHPRARRK